MPSVADSVWKLRRRAAIAMPHQRGNRNSIDGDQTEQTKIGIGTDIDRVTVHATVHAIARVIVIVVALVLAIVTALIIIMVVTVIATIAARAHRGKAHRRVQYRSYGTDTNGTQQSHRYYHRHCENQSTKLSLQPIAALYDTQSKASTLPILRRHASRSSPPAHRHSAMYLFFAFSPHIQQSQEEH